MVFKLKIKAASLASALKILSNYSHMNRAKIAYKLKKCFSGFSFSGRILILTKS